MSSDVASRRRAERELANAIELLRRELGAVVIETTSTESSGRERFRRAMAEIGERIDETGGKAWPT